MRRIRKLLGMIFILGFVFFIICDEKGYKIGFENNQIVLNKIEKKSDSVEILFDPNAVYKNSDLIFINYEFENPRNLRKSKGVDRKVLAKLEKERKIEEETNTQGNPRENEKASKDNTILSAFQGGEQQEDTEKTKQEIKQNTGITNNEIKENTGTKKQETGQKTGTVKQETEQKTGTVKQETKQNTGTVKQETKQKTGTVKQQTKSSTGKTTDSTNKSGTASKTEPEKPVVYYPVKKYEHGNHTSNLSKGLETPKVKVEKYSGREALTLNLMKGKEPGPLYKNSNRIKIYSGFENPIALRNSAGIDEEYIMRQKNNKPTIISLNDGDTISSARENNHENTEKNQSSGLHEDIDSDLFNNVEIININTGINNSEYNIPDIDENIVTGDTREETEQEIKHKVEKYEGQNHSIDLSKGEEIEKALVKVDKYEPENHTIDIRNGENIEIVEEDNYVTIEKPESYNHTIDLSKGEEIEKALVKVNRYEPENHTVDIKNGVTVENIDEQNNETIEEENFITIQKPRFLIHSLNLSKGEKPEIILVKVEKYNFNRHSINLKKGKIIEHDFVVDNVETAEQVDNGLSDAMLDSLLENEEIDINTLESENDEFLQKVFEETKDIEVMNLIVETYLNEYQFVKAKNFIDNLPDTYHKDLKPSLNLRVAFNSFSLSSKTNNENLTTIVQDYSSKNEISDEDKKWYLGVIALMDRNYDRFFEIASGFTSEKNIGFTSKLQGYKEQISKQMGMPDYYFDTLVSLELFNQGLFQPAKVLALYSLQQNPNYILPYQVLAYANFLTNSRDTSIEYFKKLVDLDPNNAEKYRFLMGVSYYRDEKYEQSVVMLSMIKDESLRLDTQRYLINNYLKLDQKNKLISSRNKLLGYENLVASDFYTYFYETFFHPYSEGAQFQLYAYDTELANKMLRVCSITLQNEEKAVCTYGTIGRNIALGQFNGLEQYLLNLATQYPQGYLYQALGDYYIQQGDLEKAKIYLIKAISLTQKKSERSQIKRLLKDTI